MPSRRLSVQLFVDGESVASQTGCQSDLMYRWAWDTREYRERRARIVVEDEVAG